MITLGDFVPPIVRKVGRRLRRRAPEVPVEQQIFADYESAARHCGRGWDDTGLARSIVADAELMLANTQRVPPQIPILELRPLSAIAWMLAEHPREEVTVVDFGGSAGHNFFAAKALYPSLRFRWLIVETAAMAAAASALASDGLTFVTDLDSVPRPDLVFSSGAIQYHPRPLELMRQLLALQAPYVALFRTAMADGGEAFSAVQRTSLRAHLRETDLPAEERTEVLYPLSFIPRSAYRDAFVAQGYEIVTEIDEGTMYQAGSGVHGYGVLARRVR